MGLRTRRRGVLLHRPLSSSSSLFGTDLAPVAANHNSQKERTPDAEN
jgi:hypothetical protein